MVLSDLEFLQGILTLVTVLVSSILGISIMSRYKKTQQVELLLVGATWILIVSGYWPDAVNFISSIVFSTLIDDTLYLVLATAFYAPIHVIWMRVITELLYKEHQKKIMSFFWIEAVIYEIILVGLFLINPLLVGDREAPFYAVFSPIVMIYFLFSLILFIITGIIFSRFYLKSTSTEIHRKGYFLLAAFTCFLIGISIDDFITPVTPITLVIARLFLMIAGLEFYFGFTKTKTRSQ